MCKMLFVIQIVIYLDLLFITDPFKSNATNSGSITFGGIKLRKIQQS